MDEQFTFWGQKYIFELKIENFENSIKTYIDLLAKNHFEFKVKI